MVFRLGALGVVGAAFLLVRMAIGQVRVSSGLLSIGTVM